jgi:hypothetical protein
VEKTMLWSMTRVMPRAAEIRAEIKTLIKAAMEAEIRAEIKTLIKAATATEIRVTEIRAETRMLPLENRSGKPWERWP